MPKIIVYVKPTCTTCRKVVKALNENGVDFEKVNYYTEPFTKEQLSRLLKKMKMILKVMRNILKKYLLLI